MKIVTPLAVAAFLAAAALAGRAEAAAAVGDPAPGWTANMKNYASPSESLEALRGKVVILEFMRTW